MTLQAVGLVALLLLGVDSDSATSASEPIDSEIAAQWQPIFGRVAAEYELLPENDSKPLKVLERPVYKWARSGAFGGTNGAIYVWTRSGCAEAVACFWRSPAADGKISVAHELHSLAPTLLTSNRTGSHPWKPSAGVQRQLLADAPVPAATESGRLRQMRSICRDFAASTVSSSDERTELRLLPQPLYRYESTDPEMVDGALFAFVCSVGTDPEVFLVLEARETKEGKRWHYALARFFPSQLVRAAQGSRSLAGGARQERHDRAQRRQHLLALPRTLRSAAVGSGTQPLTRA
jgi:hypothetical protein